MTVMSVHMLKWIKKIEQKKLKSIYLIFTMTFRLIPLKIESFTLNAVQMVKKCPWIGSVEALWPVFDSSKLVEELVYSRQCTWCLFVNVIRRQYRLSSIYSNLSRISLPI